MAALNFPSFHPVLAILLALLMSLLPLADSLMLTPAQKTETLDAHNRLRRSVYPQASNMNYLTWNVRLEDLAQRAANRCVFEHNYGGDYSGLGENLYMGFRTNTTDMVTLFFMEKLAFDYETAACNKPNIFNFATCGHYLQVAGATVLEVGCAIASCPGSNLFVCEYNSMQPSPVYASGEPCSACHATGFCLDGLCINGTIRNHMVETRNASVSCSLVCKNCGSKFEILTLTPPICSCSCPSGYGGSDCSTKQNPSAQALTCSLCAQSGTPCLNGGVEKNSSSNCSCSCPANFTGPQCQLPVNVYTSAIHLQLTSSSSFCSGGKCTQLPTNPVTFASQVWPVIRSVLVSSVNAFCRSSAANFASCCSGAAPPSGGASGDLLLAGDVRYVNFSVQLNSIGSLGVAVYAESRSDNSLCASARRRRRSAATTSTVSVSVLTDSVLQSNASFASSLSSCCDVTIASSSAYKVVVDNQFGYSSGGGSGSGNSAARPVSKDACWLLLLSALVLFGQAHA